uniref:Uncharacterized protein n=1 Tax=Rhizophora mucronata TaxID=61149 RepID=A0A2P2PWG0_RHIMU
MHLKNGAQGILNMFLLSSYLFTILLNE